MDNIRTWCYNPGTEQRFQCNSQRPNTSSYRNINLANSPFAGGPNNRTGYFSVLSTGYVSGPSHSPFYDPSILGEFQRVNYQPPSTFVSHENLILPTTSFQYHSSTRDTLRYSAPPDSPINLLGTRSAPIEVPDSPKREQSHSSRCGKRAREYKSEVEMLDLNPFPMVKKAKMRHDSKSEKKTRPPNPALSGWDGVEYANGQVVIPLLWDPVLDELLFLTEGSERPWTELPSLSTYHAC